eukprot:COSAG04_NODE_13641_length_597_cov_1.524096_1_plen_110_part_10
MHGSASRGLLPALVQPMEEEAEPFPVALAQSDARGRDYVATRPVAPGELVLRVAPLAAVPNDLFATRVCSGCFRRDCTPCPGAGTTEAVPPTAIPECLGSPAQTGPPPPP